MCGVAIQVEGERIVSIRGDKDDPFSRGYICPKAAALADIQHDPDRLRHPLRRTPSGFVRIGWDEALAEVATRLTQIQAESGPNAVAVYAGNPTVHSYSAMLYWLPFIKALKTRSRFSATSVDQLPHHLCAFLMFGHQLLLPIPDVDRTDFMLILGGNPAVSNGSLMSAPGIGKRLLAIRERGGQVVLIDPRRTETAALTDRHHFIRPGTDVLLLLALLHTLFAERLTAPGRLQPLCQGLPLLTELVAEFSPEVAAGPTGISAAEIRALARAFAGAKSAVAYGRMGVSTQEFGAVTQWLISVLNIVTGNLDRPGGAMFTKPAFDVVALTARLGEKGHFDKGRTRVRKLPEYGGEYPVAALAEEILTPGPGQIRALCTHAGNPVLSTPNGPALEGALASLDFMVSIDLYLNETTRHAHLILPPTFGLEHEHYDAVYHLLAVRNTAKYSSPLFAPAADTRHDWEILQELTAAIGSRGLAPVRRAVLRQVTPQRLLALGLRLGPYGRGPDAVSLRKLQAAEHGLDLGPLSSCLPERLFTADKKIQLVPEVLTRDLARVRRKFLAPDAAPRRADGYDLQLIGRRDLRSNNSWMHNSHRLVKGPLRCTLLIHPSDAEKRGLGAGQTARVHSRTGSIALPVEVTDEVMPGVVSIPHGWGHHRPGSALSIAEQHPGVSVNDLTDELLLDELCGNAVLNGVPVRVETA
jgi:anaerobic selenocysteine-containing dehydrogenase